MTMTNEEICREYRQAKTPLKQIRILADLNGCTKREIADILREGGEELPAQFVKGPPRPKAETERKVLEEAGLLFPVPTVGEILEPTGERVAWAAVDVIARLLKETDAQKNQKAAEYCFKENIRGVLAMVHALTESEGEK